MRVAIYLCLYMIALSSCTAASALIGIKDAVRNIEAELQRMEGR